MANPKASFKKPPRRIGKAKGKNGTSSSVLDLEAIKKKYIRIWADPTESRTDEQIAKDLGVDPSQLISWQYDPTFNVPASHLFQQNIPVLRAQVMRKIAQQALSSGSGKGMRTLAEMFGLVKGKGDVNLNLLMGDAANLSSDRIKCMTDGDLEKELERMMTLSYPHDVNMVDGKVIPASEVLDIEYEDLGPNLSSLGRGADEPQATE